MHVHNEYFCKRRLRRLAKFIWSSHQKSIKIFCLRKKKFWGPGEGISRGLGGSSISNIVAESSQNGSQRGGQNSNSNSNNHSSNMSPPPSNTMSAPAIHPMVREVTEDTPPDLLEGTMDLLVILPSKISMKMTVNRRTPMMDLLIQVTTANKINPGGHIVQVKNERGIELPYKPSTPIGMLNTTTIDIVPKNQVNEYIIVKKQAKHVNPLFEKTFRLQVHLPRNQLYVMRVGPRTVLQDILEEVCLEKNLDIEKYEIRHPVNLDEKLDLNNRLGDYGLQELTIVSRNSRINSSVSSADIMALQQIEDGRVKGRLDSAFKYSRSSVGDSSVSSESANSGRGISPTRSASDDSRSISPLPPINNPKLNMDKTVTRSNTATGSNSGTGFNILKTSHSLQQSASMDIPMKSKKRAAPAPPPVLTPTSSSDIFSNRPLTHTKSNSPPLQSNIKPITKKKDPPKEPPILLKQQSLPTTHSRHSSDSSSGYHESINPSILSEHQELQRTERSTSTGAGTIEALPLLSKQSVNNSGTNLTSVSSLSSTSLTSSNGGFSRNKRKAPKPPGSALQAQNELEEDISILTTTTDSEISSSKVKDWSNTNNNSQKSLEEVKVDVHDVKQSETQESEYDDDETETEKEKESLVEKKSSSSISSTIGQSGQSQVTKSSSSVSSLSGRTPISESGSSSRSSPMPATDDLLLSNNSQVTMSSRDSPLSSTHLHTDTSSNNMSAPSSIISRSSSANTQEDLSSAAIATPPLPQPRTKPRTRNTTTTTTIITTPTTTSTVQIPIPTARPRPDREIQISTELLNTTASNTSSSSSSTPPENNNIIKAETPTVSAPPRKARNIGVKVFPDNALDAHPANVSLKSKTTPVTPTTIKKHENENPIVSSKTETQLHGNGNDTNISTTISKNKNENNKILMNQNLLGQKEEYDSDNLEENLELFEEGRELNKSDESVEFNISLSDSSFDDDISFDTKNIHKSRKTLNKISNNDDINNDDSSSSANTISELSIISPLNESLDLNLIRTYSDQQLKYNSNNSKFDNGQEQQKKLNRWENEESLHVIERERLNSNPSKIKKTYNKANRKRDTDPRKVEKKTFPVTTSTSTTNSFSANNTTSSLPPTIIKKKTTFLHSTGNEDETFISSLTEIPVHDTNEDVGELMTSSESEASYADSGIPATTNVTPSPISLEHDHDIDRSDKDALSIGSSRRSSIHSDHSETWREILQAKVENPGQIMEKTLEAMVLDSNEVDKKLKDSKMKSSNHFETIQPQSKLNLDSTISTESNQILIPKHEDEVESSDEEIKMRTDKDEDGNNSSTRKLSKSESFTHKSEFDVKMKRKLFSGNSSNNRTHGGIGGLTVSSQLKGKSSSCLSSSDDDVHQDNLHFTSMQNLSNVDNSNIKGGYRENSTTGTHTKRRGNGRGVDEEKVFRKATSVVGLEDLAPDIAAENPQLRQTFQIELEAQFEQWKEQFLQRHLGGSKSGSIDSTSNDEQAKKLTTSITPTSESETKLKEENSCDEIKKEEEEELVTRVSSPTTTLVTQSNDNLLSLSHLKVVKDEEFDPEIPQIVHSVSGVKNLKIVGVEPTEKFKSTIIKNSADENLSSQLIQVDSTEGVQTSVNKGAGDLNKDMNGTQPVQRMQPKVQEGNEMPIYKYSGPPAIQMGTWGERPKGSISVKKDTDYIMGMGQYDTKATNPRTELRPPVNSISSRVQTFNGGSSTPSPTSTTVIKPAVAANQPTKWSGVSVNSATSATEVNAKNAGSLVSSWKLRMQESEMERKQKNDETKPEHQQQSKIPDVKIQSKSMSTTNTLEKPNVKIDFPISSSASTTLDRPTFKKAANVTSASTTLNQNRNIFEKNITIEQKPYTNGLKNTQSFQTNGTSIKQQNGNFKGDLTDGLSLDEKKKFFQGIKPAESPTKETPLPAVNMKTNIANIQRVFDQRQPRQGTGSSNSSTRDSSPSLSTSSSSASLTNSSKHPELIGIGQHNSSSLILQKVMKTQAFNMDNFRRTPSPSLSSPERFTPPPTQTHPSAQFQTTVVDGPVRITTKSNNVTASSGSINNVGNKAIIIVNSDNEPSNNNNSNIFKQQQLKFSGGTKPIENTRNNNNGVKINVNGFGNSDRNNDKTFILHTTPAPDPSPKREMFIVHKNNENKNNIITKPMLKSIETFKEPVNKGNSIQNSQRGTENGSPVPPPPPPPPSDILSPKPQNLNLQSKSSNGGLANGKALTPTSPMASDARAEINNAISHGNFKLKKTGSTVLLQ